MNTVLRGHWDQYSGLYSEVTSDGNYLYGGNFGRGDGQPARVFVIDIDPPETPTLVNEVFIPAPNDFKSPEDIFLSNGLLFVAMETGNADAVVIFDARNPPALPLLATVRLAGYGRAHNVQFHDGYLYVADSTTPRVGIADLTTFDPDNPPPSPYINDQWILINVGTSFVHEMLPITLQHPTLGTVKWLFCSAWNSGLQVYDISNVATAMPNLIGSAPGTATHSCWPSDDAKYVVTGEERSNGGIKVFRIDPAGGGLITLTQTDSLVLSTDAFSVHNQSLVTTLLPGGAGPGSVRYRIFNGWYQAGIQVHDIDPVTGLLTFVASYDTFPAGNTGNFNGCWNTFPYIGEDKIVASDLQEGFFVVALQQPLFTISYPNGLVDYIDPQDGAELTVAVTPGMSTPDPNAGTLSYTIDGGPPTSLPMTFSGGNYVGQFGSLPCGSEINYWVQVNELAGPGFVIDPMGAPTNFYTATVVDSITPIVSYNFQNTAGWAVSGDALDGQWNAGIPAGDGSRGDPTSDYDGSGACFLTDNVAGNSDVDDGSTILTSPVLNMSGLEDPVLSYARWYSNSAGAAPNADIFVVEISNNNGGSWANLETVGPAGNEANGGWFFKQFHVADVLPPTSTMRVRFNASDLPLGSVVEAAIDALKVEDFICLPAVGSCCVALSCTDNVMQPQCAGVFREGVDCTTPCECITPVECDDGVFCNGAEVCTGGDCFPGAAPCGGGTPICDEVTNSCEPPLVAPAVIGVGPRYLQITPAASSSAVALQVTSPSEPCLSLYVQIGGSLAASPVYRTPAQWGMVFANGAAILPNTAYNVAAVLPGSAASTAALGTTWKWGDVNNSALVNIDDILRVIAGFQGMFNGFILQNVDLVGCTPDGIVNLDDLLAVLSAFGGHPINCADPCP